jgi:hypothetical protein
MVTFSKFWLGTPRGLRPALHRRVPRLPTAVEENALVKGALVVAGEASASVPLMRIRAARIRAEAAKANHAMSALILCELPSLDPHWR